MVSNELFNPQGGEFFKKVCEMQRVGQILLVVNKMSAGGEPQYLIKSILEVIEPYHPNDFYTCFIDAKSYLNSQLEGSSGFEGISRTNGNRKPVWAMITA